MSLIVQTSEGVANANTYSSITTADDYAELRSRSAWAAAAMNTKRSALVNATDYMDRRWAQRLIGTKLSAAQYLEWPRTGYGLPLDIVYACIEYALYALSGDLFAEFNDAGRSHGGTGTTGIDTNQTITRQRRRAGPVEIETQFETGTRSSTTTTTTSNIMVVESAAGRYPRADFLMHRYLKQLSGRTIRN